MIPWFEVYNLISEALDRFTKSSGAKNLNPGRALYNRFIDDSDFVENNNWIKKFDKKFDVHSVDPMHVFASISANNMSFEKRTARINKILQILNYEPIVIEINFDGCPAPPIINLLTARDETAQIEIWELFNRVTSKKIKGLTKKDFDRIKDWYGVGFGSFTILLFWLKSECFIPFDKYTRTFLISAGIIEKEPRTYGSYIRLLDHLEQYNYNNGIYGDSGLFREIALLAYQTIVLNKKDLQQTPSFQKLLEDENKDSNDERLKRLAEGVSIGFKLIALRPLEGCFKEYLNVLKADTTYHFDKSILIKDDTIEYISERNIKLYDSHTISEKPLQINLSAIVGKNGSGKSSIIELFFRIVNNIAYSRKESLQIDKLQLVKGLSAELYYIHAGILYRVTVIDGEVNIQEYRLHDNNHFKPVGNNRKFLKQDFNSFFYTVAVNYSHYALNSIQIGDWARKLFHKNDAYQTPLVVNPMRTEGNININTENALVKSRLLVNLVAPISDDGDIGLRQLTENQKAIKVSFKQIEDKNRVLFYRDKKGGDREEILINALKTKSSDIYKLVKEVFEFPTDQKDKSSGLVDETKKYIIRKLVRISLTYKHYSEYFNPDKIKFNSLAGLKQYLLLLKSDRSHIVYKLKQAINYWKYPELWPREEEFIINIEDASNKLQRIEIEKKENQVIELLPPPIFSFEIVLINTLNEESDFNLLSSGEKQLIYSISSILYHLKYLDSVAEERGLIKYDCVNLILDEIELYYHPELQRKYIDYLLSMIRKIELEYITGLNICLVTHSPYILSDIPDYVTMRLENGIPSKEEYKTFGANIHDLLANEFFMGKGYMGEFAKGKINKIIEYLESKISDRLNPEPIEQKTAEFIWDKDSIKKIIELIGEPLIRNSLLELYNKAFFTTNEQIDEEIARLKKRKKQLSQK